MIETLILVCHLLLAMAIIGLVLLQRGKGAEAGTGFGAGASGTVFGARGSASFFSRATAVLATLFFATSLALAYFATQTTGGEALVGTAPADDSGVAVQGALDDPPNIGLEDPIGIESVTPPAGGGPPESGTGEGAADQ
jgi:preprotein translocase subunit SecG